MQSREILFFIWEFWCNLDSRKTSVVENVLVLKMQSRIVTLVDFQIGSHLEKWLISESTWTETDTRH